MEKEARVIGGWLVTSDGRISNFQEKEFYVGSNFAVRMTLPNVKEALLDLAQKIRDDVAMPVIITSGVRSEAANRAAGGDPRFHPKGRAFDAHVPGRTPWNMVGILEHVTLSGAIGRFGIYHAAAGGHFHVDIDMESDLRSFVKLPGKDYIPLDRWILENWPGARSHRDVPVAAANKLLGF